MKTLAVALAALIAGLLLPATSAAAGELFSGRDVKDNTVTSVDVKDQTVLKQDLSPEWVAEQK